MNRYKKVVVKIGSALITAGGKGLDRAGRFVYRRR